VGRFAQAAATRASKSKERRVTRAMTCTSRVPRVVQQCAVRGGIIFVSGARYAKRNVTDFTQIVVQTRHVMMTTTIKKGFINLHQGCPRVAGCFEKKNEKG